MFDMLRDEATRINTAVCRSPEIGCNWRSNVGAEQFSQAMVPNIAGQMADLLAAMMGGALCETPARVGSGASGSMCMRRLAQSVLPGLGISLPPHHHHHHHQQHQHKHRYQHYNTLSIYSTPHSLGSQTPGLLVGGS